jgi:transposase
MRLDLANLPTDTATLHQIIAAQAAEGEAREAELAAAKAGLLAKTLEIEKYKLQIARLRRMQFGRSSEKIARTIEQLELKLEELEAETPPAASEATAAQAEAGTTLEQPSSPQRPKSARRALPAHLPARDVVHASSCACPACGGEMRKVGEDVTEILDYIPGHFEVVRHVRPAFSCRRCESMAQSPMPSLPIERGQAGAGLLAHILVSKYCDHLPLYRQSGIYAREGVELDRATMATWVGKITALAAPLVEAVADHVMAAEKLHVDDTPVPVLAPGMGKTKTGRLWVYLRDERPFGGRAPPAVVYCYRSQGRAPARAAGPLPRLPAGRRLFRLWAALPGCRRAAPERDRGRVLGACAAILLRHPCRHQRADCGRGAATHRELVRRRAHRHGIAARTATTDSSERGSPPDRRSRDLP